MAENTTNEIRWNKRFLKFILGLFLPIIFIILISIFIFFLYTGEIPSLFLSERQYQIASSYFDLDEPIVIRSIHLYDTQSSSAWVAFQKDSYFNMLFGKGCSDADWENVNPEYDNKVVIFEELDLGIFTPVISFIWPFSKSHEISWPDGFKLYDVLVYDLEGDETEEVVIFWNSYAGGRGGSVHPLVVRFSQPSGILFETFPMVIIDETTIFSYREANYEILNVDNLLQHVEMEVFSTDAYWEFQDIDNDKHLELIIAYPQHDADCHYCPRSWIIVAYNYFAGQFTLDPKFSPTFLPKEKGYGISDIHGMTSIPDFGILSMFIGPSWIELDSSEVAQHKDRQQSMAIIELLNNYDGNDDAQP